MDQTPYSELNKRLTEKIIEATRLKEAILQQGFVNTMFKEIHKAYQEKQIDRNQYRHLLDKLSIYKGGQFDDYIDVLAGAAELGMLEIVIQAEIPQFSPEAARERSRDISNWIGVEPQEGDKEA